MVSDLKSVSLCCAKSASHSLNPYPWCNIDIFNYKDIKTAIISPSSDPHLLEKMKIYFKNLIYLTISLPFFGCTNHLTFNELTKKYNSNLKDFQKRVGVEVVAWLGFPPSSAMPRMIK